MTTCKLHLHVILCVIAPHQLSLPSVLALWVALLGKEDFCLLCILPDSTTVPHPLGHLLRFCEGPLTKQAVPACVVAPSVLRFNMDRVNLEWPVIGGNQVHKVTPFNLLLQESWRETLLSPHFPLHVFLAICTFTFARLHLRLGAAHCTGVLLTGRCSSRGHLFKPRHMLKPVPHSEVSEVVYTWSPPILVRYGVSEERQHTSHCVIRTTPKLTCRSEVFYRKKGPC